MEKILENIIDGRLNNKDVVGILYNGSFILDRNFINYTIEPDSPSEPLNTTVSGSRYKYLPRLNSYGATSHRYYELIRISLKDGSVTSDLSIPVNEIEKILICCPKEVYKISFSESKVKEVIINFNNSNVTDMRWMFENCSSLTSLDVSNFNTSNVTDMGWMFSGCTSLTNVRGISNWNTVNVKDMSSMFKDCYNLTSLDLSNFNTSKVTDIGYMFYHCTSLTSLYLSNFDTSNVTNMGSMFSNCYSLTSLNLSSFDTSNVTDMGWMFYNCSELTSLNLSSFDTSNVTDKGFMFSNVPRTCKIDVSSRFTFTELETSFSGKFI